MTENAGLVRFFHFRLHFLLLVKLLIATGLRVFCRPNSTGPDVRRANTITGGKISHCNNGVRPIQKIFGMLAILPQAPARWTLYHSLHAVKVIAPNTKTIPPLQGCDSGQPARRKKLQLERTPQAQSRHRPTCSEKPPMRYARHRPLSYRIEPGVADFPCQIQDEGERKPKTSTRDSAWCRGVMHGYRSSSVYTLTADQRYTTTGNFECASTCCVTLPINSLERPLRPCEAMTIASHFCFFAAAMIPSWGE